MRFLLIDPRKRTVVTLHGDTPEGVCRWTKDMDVDHGMVTPSVGIIVWEYGLLQGDGPYFSIRGTLYGGDAILYGVGARGEEIDMPEGWSPPDLRFFADRKEVEKAIAAGKVRRPRTTINNTIVWEWNK